MTDVARSTWLISMVGFLSPKDRVVGSLSNDFQIGIKNGGDPNHLPTGVMLQVLSDQKR